MTEKEFYQIRSNYNVKKKSTGETREGLGYFSFFKIRCLICIIVFLSVLVLDRQFGLDRYVPIVQTIQLFGKENITVEQCFDIIKFNK